MSETLTTLETARYRLRPLTLDDASECYLAWLNDPMVTRFLEVRFRRNTMDDVKSYIDSHDGKNAFLYGIFTKLGDHIGNFSLRIDPHNSIGTLGVMIGDRAHWGNDVVLETRSCVLDHAFDDLRLHKVCGACLATNVPAIYNYRRQGWQMEGVRREHAFVCDGKWVDIVMFGMLAAHWRSRGAQV
jgi:[ribosomal protein S5]-alanine N-acetyltransferase